MRLLSARHHDLPTGPVSKATLTRLYRFPRRRWLRANFVSTLDGAAQGSDGLSGTINTEADHRVFAINRQLADAVVVGAGTAQAENYRPADLPLIIVSRRGVLPPGLVGPSTAGRVILATCAASGAQAAPDVWVCGREEVDLRQVCERAAHEGYGRLLCEGGPRLFGDLLTAGLVDDLALTTSPMLVGGDALRVNAADAAPVNMHLRHLLEHDGTLLALWRIAPGSGRENTPT